MEYTRAKWTTKHRPLEERFWEKVDCKGPDDCWLWKASCFKSGYGAFGNSHGSIEQAHRVAYRLSKGPIPPGMFICHSCDNRRCCNPAHLWPGTNGENIRDAMVKGRLCCGEDVLHAKLTEDQVREIRGMYRRGVVTHQKIAKQFGISRRTVTDILKHRLWRHVT